LSYLNDVKHHLGAKLLPETQVFSILTNKIN
jgi:hypothetical protein